MNSSSKYTVSLDRRVFRKSRDSAISEEVVNVGGVIMKRKISIGLRIVGSLLLLIGLMFGAASILALIARAQHGPGLLFADVEFFGMIALIAALLGAAVLFAAKKLSAFWKPDVPSHNPIED